jgi:hypothetical protein
VLDFWHADFHGFHTSLVENRNKVGRFVTKLNRSRRENTEKWSTSRFGCLEFDWFSIGGANEQPTDIQKFYILESRAPATFCRRLVPRRRQNVAGEWVVKWSVLLAGHVEIRLKNNANLSKNVTVAVWYDRLFHWTRSTLWPGRMLQFYQKSNSLWLTSCHYYKVAVISSKK